MYSLSTRQAVLSHIMVMFILFGSLTCSTGCHLLLLLLPQLDDTVVECGFYLSASFPLSNALHLQVTCTVVSVRKKTSASVITTRITFNMPFLFRSLLTPSLG